MTAANDLATEELQKKTSVMLDRPSMAWYPPNQWMVSEMFIDLEGATAHVERLAQDWSDGVDHGGLWPAKLVSAKYHAVEATKRVVDRAMDLSGGAGMVQGQRARTALSRRALRRIPSRERGPGARWSGNRHSGYWAEPRF